jgi:hypothetical protein
MKLSEHIQNIRSLKLPNGQYVVVSSGTLALHGIRDAKDIDLIVKPELWNKLSKKYEVFEKDGVLRMDTGSNIEILGEGSMYMDSNKVPTEIIFAQAEMHENIKFMNLTHLRKIKSLSAREKDHADVVLIDEYLNKKDK